jgi:hypothetical protein
MIWFRLKKEYLKYMLKNRKKYIHKFLSSSSIFFIFEQVKNVCVAQLSVEL